jgi:hypothetical protein
MRHHSTIPPWHPSIRPSTLCSYHPICQIQSAPTERASVEPLCNRLIEPLSPGLSRLVPVREILYIHMSMMNTSKYLYHIFNYTHTYIIPYIKKQVLESGNLNNLAAYIHWARNVWESWDAQLPFLAKTGSCFHADSRHLDLWKWNARLQVVVLPLHLIYITLHYINITYNYITLHYVTLHYLTLHQSILHCIRLRYITLSSITLH